MPMMMRSKKMQDILNKIIGKPANMVKAKKTNKSTKINTQLLNQESSRLR